LGKAELRHFYSVRSIYLQSFLLISLVVSELCPGQSSKCKNEQKAIIPELGKADLWFLCTALPLNDIYLPTTFLVDTFCSFRVISRKAWWGWMDRQTYPRTDARTDGQSGHQMLSLQEHKNLHLSATLHRQKLQMLITIYLHSLLIFYRKKRAFNLCIAQRSGTASRAWHLLPMSPLTGSCLSWRNILQYFLSKFRKPCVCILFDYLQSLLDGSWKAEAKSNVPLWFSHT